MAVRAGKNDMKRPVGEVVIECLMGDITKQTGIDAVVNAANARLLPGGGVAGAIHRAAGPELEQECRPLAPIRPGQAVITRGYGLPNPYVIHCLGPVYGQDEPSDVLLADCYRNALRLADERNLSSVAFPAISTGAFGYPLRSAAQLATRTLIEEAGALSTVRTLRLVLHDHGALTVHSQALEEEWEAWKHSTR